MIKSVEANPYPYPYNGDLRPENTALIVIDMQVDFCGLGGYLDKKGYDVSLTRAPIEPIKSVLAAARQKNFQIFFTRPKQPTISLYSLVEGEYTASQFRGNDRIQSPPFPDLNLTAKAIFQAASEA